MTSLPRATTVRSLKLQDLQTLASDLDIGLDFGGYKKKKDHLLEDVLAYIAEKREQEAADAPLNVEQQAVKDRTDISKSEKIRQLFTLGISIAQISRELSAHYSLVHGVVRKMQAKELVISEEPEAKMLQMKPTSKKRQSQAVATA